MSLEKNIDPPLLPLLQNMSPIAEDCSLEQLQHCRPFIVNNGKQA